MTTNNQKYWAFISYSSKDKKLAKRLFNNLETYRIPRDLVGRLGYEGTPVPRRLFPIFRDRDELPLSADLGASIQDALRASRYLIVICTPDAAQSQWVNEEIRFFKSTGRGDRILAIMAKGEPNASDDPKRAANECFPPALRYHVGADGLLTDIRCEPIAGDLRPGGDGWRACLLKAAAGVTGLGYDAFAKRQAKRQFIQNGFVAAALLVLIACLGGWWDYTRTKTFYYAATTQRWGAPEGVFRLEEKIVGHRNLSYRIESSRQKVRRVLRVNSTGQLRDDVHNFNASIQEIDYREDGSVQQISLRDHNRRLVVRCQFTQVRHETDGPVIFVEYKSEHEDAPLALPALRSSFETLSTDSDEPSKSAITVHRIVYSADGLPARVTYLNSYRQPRATGEAVFGQALRYNQNRLIIELTNLGYDGQPSVTTQGIRTQRTERDSRGNEIALSYYNAKGEAILLKGLAAKVTYKYDDRGNLVEQAYFGPDANSLLIKDGYAKLISKYDERGNRAEEAYFGSDGNPALHKDGFARCCYKYDKRGNVVERTYFGTDGKPTLHKHGYASITSKYDGAGNQVEATCFGTDGQPVLNIDGIAKYTSRYNERGDEVESACFGTDGQRVLNTDGYATVTVRYDERGKAVASAYFGTDGQPMLNTNGYSTYTVGYDERGNVVERAYFGTDGQPVLSIDGIAKYTSRYNERGDEVEAACFGTDGKASLNKDGYAKLSSKYDERGNRIQQACFGTDEKLWLNKEGYANAIMNYDERGNQIQQAYFGTDGQLLLNNHGFAKVTSKYDERGNLIEQAYFGTNGQPALNTEGYAGFISKYDERGNTVHVAYFGTNGQPALNTEGYAGFISKYDERDNRVEEVFFGTDGQPALNTEGYARSIFKYDDRGNNVDAAYFGIDEKPMSFAGIGVAVQKAISEIGLRVERILPEGPAHKSGQLFAGDHIVAVAETNAPPRDLRSLGLSEAVLLLRGRKGTPITLTLARTKPDGSTFETNITLIRDVTSSQ